MNALEKLQLAISTGKHICVGLDSDLDKIPEFLLKCSNPIFEFNKKIIEATADYAAAYKLNFAFYEHAGIKGIEALIQTLKIIPRNLLVIADAKRGDIGNTSEKYAQSIFEYFNFDSVTLHPYMGFDTIDPFKSYANKLSFILGLTSNPGSKDFELLELKNGSLLFQEVIKKVNEWNVLNNLGIVFGATNPEALIKNFSLISNLPVLLPGIGAQGGNLHLISEIFTKKNKNDYLVNISRSLIFADSSENFADKVREKIIEFNEHIVQ